MKAVILAGGFGTRLSEETEVRPKPMVDIGGRPILWHILKHYSHHGVTEFLVALGYKGDQIKRFFIDYHPLSSNMTVSVRSGHVDVHESGPADDWTVNLLDTGVETNTGGRLKRLEKMLGGETFMLTYGDGVSDIDLEKLLAFHRRHGRLATITAVRPPARFGSLVFDGERVAEFQEKPQVGEGWINGGFMALEPGVFRYLEGDESSLEANALEALARDGQLMAFKHEGFWQCVDTLRELRGLQRQWAEGRAPWKVWR